ncbi:hypothetical protein FIBSPDRAFT_113085 [Athelia psychrophila]|uniref:Uncharacterized protein n=1 Tax=Athelia psychrophila TaxID=1759441 RepID=A0A166TI23_9AGAM|nr:hypothetical protein FIBSPDRAFT_113085 [Fibularhizoctonia sp. CBS 109695]
MITALKIEQEKQQEENRSPVSHILAPTSFQISPARPNLRPRSPGEVNGSPRARHTSTEVADPMITTTANFIDVYMPTESVEDSDSESRCGIPIQWQQFVWCGRGGGGGESKKTDGNFQYPWHIKWWDSEQRKWRCAYQYPHHAWMHPSRCSGSNIARHQQNSQDLLSYFSCFMRLYEALGPTFNVL